MRFAVAISFGLLFFGTSQAQEEKNLAQTCGKLFGAKQTAMRLRDGGFSEKQTLEETLNRPEWHGASMNEVVWAARIVGEAYAQPEIETSQVIRECRARAQGLSLPEPINLPADLK